MSTLFGSRGRSPRNPNSVDTDKEVFNICKPYKCTRLYHVCIASYYIITTCCHLCHVSCDKEGTLRYNFTVLTMDMTNDEVDLLLEVDEAEHLSLEEQYKRMDEDDFSLDALLKDVDPTSKPPCDETEEEQDELDEILLQVSQEYEAQCLDDSSQDAILLQASQQYKDQCLEDGSEDELIHNYYSYYCHEC